MLKLSLDRDYRAAIYLRLSKEDGDFSFSGEKLESDSISNQRMLILDYLKKHPEITVVGEYVDDGFTGANFERPDFNRMMDDVKAGKIDCIVVKDLSRFGREYIGSGEYIMGLSPLRGSLRAAPPKGTEVSLYPTSPSWQAAAPHGCLVSLLIAHSQREVMAAEDKSLREKRKDPQH